MVFLYMFVRIFFLPSSLLLGFGQKVNDIVGETEIWSKLPIFLIILTAYILIRICFGKEVRTFLGRGTVALWVGLNCVILSAFSNLLAMFVNADRKMPALVPEKISYAAHLSASEKTKLIPLCDYIDSRNWPNTLNYLFHGDVVSPGDLILAFGISICLWLLVFLLIRFITIKILAVREINRLIDRFSG